MQVLVRGIWKQVNKVGQMCTETPRVLSQVVCSRDFIYQSGCRQIVIIITINHVNTLI